MGATLHPKCVKVRCLCVQTCASNHEDRKTGRKKRNSLEPDRSVWRGTGHSQLRLTLCFLESSHLQRDCAPVRFRLQCVNVRNQGKLSRIWKGRYVVYHYIHVGHILQQRLYWLYSRFYFHLPDFLVSLN